MKTLTDLPSKELLTAALIAISVPMSDFGQLQPLAVTSKPAASTWEEPLPGLFVREWSPAQA
jgi:hypothetical protein